MSRCTDACIRPTPAQCHCPTCHRTFGGVTGFDAHRLMGKCLDPGIPEIGYSQDDKGIWRMPMSDADRVRLQAL